MSLRLKAFFPGRVCCYLALASAAELFKYIADGRVTLFIASSCVTTDQSNPLCWNKGLRAGNIRLTASPSQTMLDELHYIEHFHVLASKSRQQ